MTVATAPGVLPAAMASRYPQGYAVVDVETSGFSPASDRVLQVAVVQLAPDGTERRSWSTLLNPGCDPGPVHVHGLTRERLSGAPQFADVVAQIADLLQGRILVAHNAQFDWKFLAAEARRSKTQLPVDSRLCTMALTRRLDLPLPNLKLESVAAYWGVRQLAAHDAVDDTRVLVEVLRHSLVVADALGLALPLTPCDGPPPSVYPPAPARTPCRWAYPGRWTPSTPLVQGMKVVITGETHIPRETLTARATAAGLDVMSSVSSKTSVVVCPDLSYRTRKLEAARAHGTPIVSEEEFLHLLTAIAAGQEKAAAPAASRPTTVASRATPAARPLSSPAASPAGPLAGRRVLVLGGPHTEAAAARARIGLAGGQVAVNYTSSVTDVVALDGADVDPRWHRCQAAGLPVLDAETLVPTQVRTQAPPSAAVTAPPLVERASAAPSNLAPVGQRDHSQDADAPASGVPVVLPRGAVMDLVDGVDWSLSVRWTDAGAAETAEVDVVAFLTDDDEDVSCDEDFVFFNSPAHPSTAVDLELDLPGEALVNIRPGRLPEQTRRVVVAAALADGRVFGDVGPLELTLRDDDGATVARATLDAATQEQSLVLAVLYQRGTTWRFRAVGQGYATGLADLAVRHGVDVED